MLVVWMQTMGREVIIVGVIYQRVQWSYRGVLKGMEDCVGWVVVLGVGQDSQ